ncbi:hypothetical protein [Streptomyces sp. NPDC041003]|uniref:hypothetical protein n=1 Tax=Streptomyces sp. NPDC041003 TaxID=3155730 RepID=UPI0033E03A0E
MPGSAASAFAFAFEDTFENVFAEAFEGGSDHAVRGRSCWTNTSARSRWSNADQQVVPPCSSQGSSSQYRSWSTRAFSAGIPSPPPPGAQAVRPGCEAA